MRRTTAIAGLISVLALSGAAFAADKVQVGDGKVFPESFAATPDGTLYAGSISMGVIFKAAPGATKAEKFIDKPADGPGAVLGVYADAKGGTLWACYSDLAIFGGKAGLPAVVRSYDLESGSLEQSYTLPDGSFCNDVTTGPDGSHYVADTAGARILKIRPNSTTLDAWLADKALAGVDGISFSPDGKLYANSVSAGTLMRVDINDDGTPGKVTPLTTSAPLKGPDGMRFGSDGVLYLAENGAGQADAVAIKDDTATITPVITGLDAPTAVDKPGPQLFVLEAKVDKMQDPNEAGPFYIVPAP